MLENFNEIKDEFYFDVQGPGASAERVAELITKVTAGIFVAYFSLHELIDEITEYKTLRREKRKVSGES